MQNKNILLISLLMLILILNIGAVMANDTQEINNEKISIKENLNEIDQTTINQDINEETEYNANTNFNNNDDKKIITPNSNTNSKLNSKNSNESNLKISNSNNQSLKSTFTIDGKANNQMTNPTIQNAIDNANSGDTILITGKNYVHCHFVIDKPLNIISTVGTKMSPCPGSTVGSGTKGIFYISPQASGTIIQGFTLINEDIVDETDSYGVLVRGASNVEITDCTIKNNNGDAIRIEDSTNTIIKNSIVQNSNIGINIINSKKTSIINNNISSNIITGVYMGLNNKDTTIKENNITSNKQTGIHIISADYIYILNNFIAYNRDGDQSNSKTGAGVYVNCNITKIEIKGNYIKQNGLYGVLNDYRVRNMDASRGAEYLEVISDNYFAGHSERVAYHIVYKPYSHGDFIYDSENDIFIQVSSGTGDYDVDKSVVYLGYNYLVGSELVCGSTLYKAPSTTWGEANARLKIGEITQIKPGVYSVSIIDSKGNVAKDLSSLYITFYLNKNDTKMEPQKGDIYKTVLMKNGVATVSFTKKDYLETDNILTACFPGLFDDYKSNDYKIFKILDSDIPEDIKEDNNTNHENSEEYTNNTSLEDKDKNAVSEVPKNTVKEETTAKVNTKIKLKQKIISKNKSFAPKTDNYYYVLLKDQNNKVIKNKKVKFTINGKTYIVKTNSKGIAKLKINLSKKKTYKIKINSPATKQYKALSKTNKITIKKLKQKIISKNESFAPKTDNYYYVLLKDQNNKVIKNKKITIKIEDKIYWRTTNNKGMAKVKINLAKVKVYNVRIRSPITNKYKAAEKINKIIIKKLKQKTTNSNKKPTETKEPETNPPSVNEQKPTESNEPEIKPTTTEPKPTETETNTSTSNDTNTKFINPNLSNDEIQKIISESLDDSNIEFLGSNYNEISLNINKSLNIYSKIGTRLNGVSGKPVITINSDNVNLSNFNIIANSLNDESDSILVTNASNVNISDNTITNSLDSSKMNDYNDGSTILPGTGIKILNCNNISVINNKISSFESGIYNEYSKNLFIYENQIKSNNYGINYGFGSYNTKIFNNTITENIGWYIMDVPEGPRGYGIFLNNSAVNITITKNNICKNYMGISIDANKSTGIVITSNLISDNSLEGIRFNAGYDLADNVVEPIVSDNAIYRNAKGPSMMILGEMSANPDGIYGAGERDEELRLKIGYNWYGVNSLRTWDNASGIVGVGTMCPRIKTNTISFNEIEFINPRIYSIKFYKNGELATNLTTFDLYATLNRGTIKGTEVKFDVVGGIATFSFDKEYYLDNDNKIEISVGSLINVVDRIYTVFYEYNVPNAEIPT